MSADYFNHVVKQLVLEDMTIMGYLLDKDATATFKAIKRGDVSKASEMTEATFRKTINKLQATHFIETVAGGKEHKLYLTIYGQQAINQSLEGEDEE